MADPTKYTPGYDFSDYQAAQPNKPLPGQQLDVQLADIAQSLGETIDALADVRRSDGRLQNASVIADSLAPTLISDIAADVLLALGTEAEEAVQEALPQWRGAWVTARAYAVNDLAREAGSTYICLIAHTSGVFPTDLSAARWETFAQQGAAGAGTGNMLSTNNLSDVANVATSRANLGVAAAVDTLLKADNLTGLVDPAAARTNLGAQTLNANLTSLAALTLAADRGLYATGVGTLALFTLTAAARALLDDSDAATQRTTLGLGALAVLSSVTTAQIAAAALRTLGEGFTSPADTELATAAWVDGFVPVKAAAAAYGSVGSLAYCARNGVITEGTTYAGSELFPAGIYGAAFPTVDGATSTGLTRGGTALSGTWRALGRANQGPPGSTLFLRIS